MAPASSARNSGRFTTPIQRGSFYAALLAVLVLQVSLDALALLTVLAVLSFALYRGFHVQRLRYSRLELLYKYTRSVDQALQDESVLETVRLEACQRPVQRRQVIQDERHWISHSP